MTVIPAMDKIGRIRAFNRFYTTRIGLLDRVSFDGLGLTNARLLFEIGSRERTSARELAGVLGFDEGYMSRVIKKLERRGLITRTPSPRDARVNLLGLTEDGRTTFARLVRTASEAVGEMIATLPDATVDQVLEAMNTIEGVLSWPPEAEVRIREIETGDIGWIIKRHGELYAASEGFDMSFEALVAGILSGFVANREEPAEKGWIAESEGLRLGSVFVVREDDTTARLRLMLVEPFARGKGIGQMLVDTAIRHARAQGFETMVLWTQQGLESACRLYERNGFRLVVSKPARAFGRDAVDQSWELRL
ncbi:bifunctional helix-turn-helix transcriptional regulator/GNAT family N-acetyltransferase [Tropicimonas sp. IMCC6043]|uniref:bifunctional helix-turn-helix transcriptional regulator/GNAT family N-acetyltransferase n=1 Tax=Tropicimonas sp. IMCC6043 TaxID=2510645 RepID=UPI00101C04AB|nr:bifunctional helix-turn-helix transcriptional regulator/GNAT family N-acetyltransferase [Tropicimonas sp. IMCC6043]RYH09025.1 GNAT family N-acetyltransferase [Tropicimonas sp. IMCC6043]